MNAHSSELNNFSIAITSKREHILKTPIMLTIWIFRLRCARCERCTPNKLFLGKKDLTAAYLTYSKITTFFRYAYLNTLNAALDEFVSEYSVPRIITQYQRLLLSTRDYPDFRDYYSVPETIRYHMGTVCLSP